MFSVPRHPKYCKGIRKQKLHVFQVFCGENHLWSWGRAPRLSGKPQTMGAALFDLGRSPQLPQGLSRRAVPQDKGNPMKSPNCIFSNPWDDALNHPGPQPGAVVSLKVRLATSGDVFGGHSRWWTVRRPGTLMNSLQSQTNPHHERSPAQTGRATPFFARWSSGLRPTMTVASSSVGRLQCPL